ncbi:MAG: SMEK domain-containing protein [Pseudanabaena sp. CAN_BIN31]|nr:SMEK domain-containing protein [Pseudanabaena sp. CAN_BIN31]
MLAIKDFREDVRLGLTIFQEYVRPGGSLNLTDINIHAEDFVSDILNVIHSWSLINTNKTTSNYPCIDLLEKTQRIGIQVTSEKGANKINKTIECLDKNGVSELIDNLKVFSLIPKQGSYSITKKCANVSFNWQSDVLDCESLICQINKVTDLNQLQKIHKVVTSAMPKIFAIRHDTIRELRARLEADLSIFDRQVMDAPFQFEDPLLMYKSICQMRIALQKNASSTIRHEVAARIFKEVKKILIKMEYGVRERFPYIHDAAISDSTYIDYKNGDFGEAIILMMGIRSDLNPLLDELQHELEKLDVEL